ncbi:hypothetical protein EAF04_005150 [Stromatinia cepivora]|nr:hypothetical protein EAF04_005150 [Stromatinia cepivora]
MEIKITPKKPLIPSDTPSFGIEFEFLLAVLKTPEIPNPNPSDPRTVYFPPTAEDGAPSYFQVTAGKEDWANEWSIYAHIKRTLSSIGLPTEPGKAHSNFAMWEITSDGSIERPKPPRRGNKKRIVRTPAYYYTEDALTDISDFCKIMRKNYLVTVNASCGLHVHIGYGLSGFELPHLRRLGALIEAFEPQIDSIHPAHRIDGRNSHCTSFRRGTYYQWQFREDHSRDPRILETIATVLSCSTRDQFRAFVGSEGPSGAFGFVGGNSSWNFERMGTETKPKVEWVQDTIEFRGHEGTLDPDVVSNWTRLLVGLVRYTREPNMFEFGNLLQRVTGEKWISGAPDAKVTGRRYEPGGRMYRPVFGERWCGLVDFLRVLGLEGPATHYESRQGKYLENGLYNHWYTSAPVEYTVVEDDDDDGQGPDDEDSKDSKSSSDSPSDFSSGRFSPFNPNPGTPPGPPPESPPESPPKSPPGDPENKDGDKGKTGAPAGLGKFGIDKGFSDSTSSSGESKKSKKDQDQDQDRDSSPGSKSAPSTSSSEFPFRNGAKKLHAVGAPNDSPPSGSSKDADSKDGGGGGGGGGSNESSEFTNPTPPAVPTDSLPAPASPPVPASLPVPASPPVPTGSLPAPTPSGGGYKVPPPSSSSSSSKPNSDSDSSKVPSKTSAEYEADALAAKEVLKKFWEEEQKRKEKEEEDEERQKEELEKKEKDRQRSSMDLGSLGGGSSERSVGSGSLGFEDLGPRDQEGLEEMVPWGSIGEEEGEGKGEEKEEEKDAGKDADKDTDKDADNDDTTTDYRRQQGVENPVSEEGDGLEYLQPVGHPPLPPLAGHLNYGLRTATQHSHLLNGVTPDQISALAPSTGNYAGSRFHRRDREPSAPWFRDAPDIANLDPDRDPYPGPVPWLGAEGYPLCQARAQLADALYEEEADSEIDDGIWRGKGAMGETWEIQHGEPRSRSEAFRRMLEGLRVHDLSPSIRPYLRHRARIYARQDWFRNVDHLFPAAATTLEEFEKQDDEWWRFEVATSTIKHLYQKAEDNDDEIALDACEAIQRIGGEDGSGDEYWPEGARNPFADQPRIQQPVEEDVSPHADVAGIHFPRPGQTEAEFQEELEARREMEEQERREMQEREEISRRLHEQAQRRLEELRREEEERTRDQRPPPLPARSNLRPPPLPPRPGNGQKYKAYNP